MKPRVCLTVLCQHPEHADYQAFPQRALSLEPRSVGLRLKLAGAANVRTDGRRLTFGWHGARVTLYPTGRLILERVRPKDRPTAVSLVAQILGAADGFLPVAPCAAAGTVIPREVDCIWRPLPMVRALRVLSLLSAGPAALVDEQPPFPPIPLLCRPVDFPHLPQLTADRLGDSWTR